MPTSNSYADLEIRILERQDAGYPVEVTLNGGQEFPRGFLAADILHWTPTGDPRADGERLFAALFGDAAARTAWDQARGQHPQRRVRLRVDTTAPELHALPWELLHDGQTFLAADATTPFSRYLPLPAPPGGPVIGRPIRVLAVIANPADLTQYNLAPLDVAAERQSLEAALSGLPAALLHLDFLDAPVTLERLERALAPGYHVLHFIGHGTFKQRRGQAALYLQDNAGNTHIVKDDNLSAMLKRQATCPHLIFLAACQSATRTEVDAFAGLAPKLIEAGIPAVVAMQDRVSRTTTRKLTPVFYEELFRHGAVDRALNSARSLLLTDQSPDAGVPVLLMRLKEGQLFQVAADVHQAVQQRYSFLENYVYDVATTIESVTQWFVGRDFVFEWLETQLQIVPCGYLRLVADAGLGKTAIAAEIAKRYGAIIHFVNASQGVTRSDQCLNHLAASLIARYELPHGYLPERAGLDANFLQTVLQEAADQRGDAPVLLVIDALDEADPVYAGRNWLHLPDHLPQGVYVLLTHRPGDYPIAANAQTPQPEPLVIAWDDAGQQDDITAYLRRQAERPEIHRALAEATPPIAVEQFVIELQMAAEGNFKYLDYVLADIAAREVGFDPLDMQGLPRGLRGYYAHFWAQMEQVKGQEGWAEWKGLYRPVIELLGVAGEPVTAEWLADHTGREADEIEERALARWVRFLRCERRIEGARTWRIIHRSFSDFLAEKVDLPAAHRRVAKYYLDAWGGCEAGLPHLDTTSELHNGYGLRHLVSHLAAAGDKTILWSLLVETPTWRKAQEMYDPSLTQYAYDIERAIPPSNQWGVNSVPQVVAYNLLYANIVSRVASIPSTALALMTTLGQLELALRFADLRTRPEQRTKAYIDIGNELLQQGNIAKCVELLARAEIAAMQITYPGTRSCALSRIAQLLYQAGEKQSAQNTLSHALDAIAHKENNITDAVIAIAETAIAINDSAVLRRLLPIAMQNQAGGSGSRAIYCCRLALTLGKGGCRDELMRFLQLNPLSQISKTSRAFTLSWMALGLVLVGETEIAEELFDLSYSMLEGHVDNVYFDQKKDSELDVKVWYSPMHSRSDVELARLAANAHLGKEIDPLDTLIKATDLFDGRSSQAILYSDRREHLDQIKDRKEYILQEVVQVMIQNGDLDQIRTFAEMQGLLEVRVELLVHYAEESVKLGKHKEAEEALQRALQAIDEFTERYYEDWPNRLRNLRLVVDAIVQCDCSQLLEEALVVAERSKGSFSHNDYYAHVQALAVVARALAYRGNNQRANEVLDYLLRIPRSTDTALSELRLYSSMMLAFVDSGDANRAREAAQKTMKSAEIIGDCSSVIPELTAIAQGCVRSKDRDGLMDLLGCARRIEEGDYSRGLILIEIARAMSQIDDKPDMVIDVITAAASICEDAKSYCTNGASFETLVGMAHIFEKTGNIEGLLHLVAAASDLYKRTSAYGFTQVISAVGLAFVRLSKFDRASEVLSRVQWEYVYYRWLHDHHSDGFVAYNLAQIEALSGNLDKALSIAEIPFHGSYGRLNTRPDKEYVTEDDLSTCDLYVAVAQAWLVQTKPQCVQEQSLILAIEVVSRIENTLDRFQGLIMLSRFLTRMQRQHEALKILEVALKITKTFPDRAEQARTMYTTAEVLVDIGEVNRACEILTLAEELTMSLQDSQTRIALLRLLAKNLIEAGASSQARAVMLKMAGMLELENLDSNESIWQHVNRLEELADLYIQIDEVSEARRLLLLALEATERLKDEYERVRLVHQARLNFRIGDSEKGLRILLSVLKILKPAGSTIGWKDLKFIADIIAENAGRCSQDIIVCTLLEIIQSAKSGGRDEVLECISVFAFLLSNLGVAVDTWEHIKAVEARRF